MSDLVGNPEDRFSRVAAPLLCRSFEMFLISFVRKNEVARKKSFEMAGH